MALRRPLAFSALLLTGCTVASDSHGDPYASVFGAFAIILACALVGRFLGTTLKQSTVLGELTIGILLGTLLMALDRPVVHIVRNQEVVSAVVQRIEAANVSLAAAVDSALSASSLVGSDKDALRQVLTSAKAAHYANLVRYLQLFSTIGISLLLFMVGLEGSIPDLLAMGSKALVIALTGLAATLGLGYLVLSLRLTSSVDPRLAFFGAATVGSTSAGITARVLKDMGKLATREARLTMGAAVFDDILGLVLLAVLVNVMMAGQVDGYAVGMVVAKIAAFLVAVVFFGLKILPRIVLTVETLDPQSIRLVFPFLLMLALSYLANLFGLAMIIGAYFAGLMIKDHLFRSGRETGQSTIESLIAPIEGIFVPVFFVLMGMQVDITLFGNTDVLITGAALSAAAILGKLGAGVFLPAPLKKMAVGWGMVPRGEVVLIFANIGKGMGIIKPHFYAVTVMVVLITALISPLALMSAYRAIDAEEPTLPPLSGHNPVRSG